MLNVHRMTLHVSLAHHIAFVLCTVELAAVLRLTCFSATVQGVVRQRRRPHSTLTQSSKSHLKKLARVYRACTWRVSGRTLGCGATGKRACWSMCCGTARPSAWGTSSACRFCSIFALDCGGEMTALHAENGEACHPLICAGTPRSQCCFESSGLHV